MEYKIENDDELIRLDKFFGVAALISILVFAVMIYSDFFVSSKENRSSSSVGKDVTGEQKNSQNVEDDGTEHELAKFVTTDKFMNLRGVDIIDEYPILVNWLVEFVAGMLGKKYPRSYKSVQEVMSEREEHMKSLNKKESKVKTSLQNK